MADRFRSLMRVDGPDLTLRQLALLEALTAGEANTVRGMAKHLGVSKPVITRALNSLARAGYVVRDRDVVDRRSVNIVLTPAGNAFIGACERAVA